MPSAARWLVRCALGWLIAGATVGALLLARKAAPWLGVPPWSWRFLHAELLVIGFAAQFAAGIAFWILPRDAERPPAARAAWTALALLNGGLGCTIAARLGAPLPPWLGWGLALAGVVALATHAVPRVRAARFGP